MELLLYQTIKTREVGLLLYQTTKRTRRKPTYHVPTGAGIERRWRCL